MDPVLGTVQGGPGTMFPLTGEADAHLESLGYGSQALKPRVVRTLPAVPHSSPSPTCPCQLLGGDCDFAEDSRGAGPSLLHLNPQEGSKADISSQASGRRKAKMATIVPAFLRVPLSR